MEGVINLDKPAGMSSARAVGRIKRMLPRNIKVGHAGTLDPFATGVLVILVGRPATRMAEHFMSQPKQYHGTVKLGATTVTLDPTSPEILTTPPPPPVEAQRITQVLPGFTGLIIQRPPAYSALKIAGRCAYKLARDGQPVVLEPRPVTVYGLRILDYCWPLLSLEVDCGRGTYIRSLAADIGQSLGMGGYLTQLRRTRVGDFTTQNAATLEQVEQRGVAEFLQALPTPPK